MVVCNACYRSLQYCMQPPICTAARSFSMIRLTAIRIGIAPVRTVCMKQNDVNSRERTGEKSVKNMRERKKSTGAILKSLHHMMGIDTIKHNFYRKFEQIKFTTERCQCGNVCEDTVAVTQNYILSEIESIKFNVVEIGFFLVWSSSLSRFYIRRCFFCRTCALKFAIQEHNIKPSLCVDADSESWAERDRDEQRRELMFWIISV